MLKACSGQLRTGGMGKPFAVDFNAVMSLGAARGADLELLSDALPDVENAILAGLAGEEEEE